MIYLDLFLAFLEVGCFSFGGAYGAIPLVRDVVLARGWMDEDMLSYIIAVSESTPGPIMVNLATYVGSTKAGIIGSAIATLAVILPAFFIILIVALVMKRFLKNNYVNAALSGLKPSIIGVIFATGFFMVVKNLFSFENGISVNLRAVIITVILSGIYFGLNRVIKKKISPIALIAISAVLGTVIYSI